MRSLRKQKFTYFALDRHLVRRHKFITGLIIGFQGLALLAVIAINALPNRSAYAASYVWDGGGTTNNWSDCNNWSANTCPTAADTVTFNNTSTKHSTIDASFGGAVTSITIANAYTGTITQARNVTTSGAFAQSGGTFIGSSDTLDIDGSFTLNNGAVFTAPSGELMVATNITINAGATFNHNNGTFTFDGAASGSMSCNNVSFHLVKLTNTGPKTINSNCNLPVGTNPTVGRITLNGTLSGSGMLTLGSTNINTFNAGATLSGFNGLVGGQVTIAGASLNLSGYSTVDINNSFVLSSGSFTAPAQASFAAAFTISGGTFNHNNGTITFDGSGTVSCNNATFNHVEFHNTGNVVVSSNCTLPVGHNPVLGSGGSGGHVTLQGGKLTGSGTLTALNTLQLRTGYDISNFDDLVIAGLVLRDGVVADFSSHDSLTVVALVIQESSTMISGSWNLPISNYMTVTPGSVFNPNGGTVTLTGANQALTGDITFHNLVKEATSPNTLTIAAGSTITVENNLTLHGADQDSLLSLVSSAPGTQWNIDAQGSRALQYLSVQDSNNINTDSMLAYDSEDLGNDINWQFLASPTPEPPVDPDAGGTNSGDTSVTGRGGQLADTGTDLIAAVVLSATLLTFGSLILLKYRRRVR